MKYIALELPNHLFATKTEHSLHPDTGEFVKYINDFITLRVAPDTITDRTQHLLTTYEKLENFCAFRRGYTDPSEPDFIDLLGFFVSKGVKFLNNYPFKRGKGYFALDLFVKLSNAEYQTIVPTGMYGADETSTWEDLVTNGVLNITHSNDTHKFVYYYPVASDSEFKALLNHIAIRNNKADFDVFSLREFLEQQTEDSTEE